MQLVLKTIMSIRLAEVGAIVVVGAVVLVMEVVIWEVVVDLPTAQVVFAADVIAEGVIVEVAVVVATFDAWVLPLCLEFERLPILSWTEG